MWSFLVTFICAHLGEAVHTTRWPYPHGHPTCPCIDENSGAWNYSRKLLQEKSNKSLDHGMKGCQKYNAKECGWDEFPNSCHRAWCYVDLDKCGVIKELCSESGGQVGDREHVHCRGRPTTESRWVSNGTLQFSYETCGNLGSFQEGSRFHKWLSGLQIQAGFRKADEDDPTYQQYFLNELAQRTVVQFEKIKAKDVYNSAAPDLVDAFRGEDRWWSRESEDMVRSMEGANDSMTLSKYSYCLHDVAVGNLDLCVADMWATPERVAVVSFLPPIRFDNFFLVEKMQPSQPHGFLAGFAAVFRPFSQGAWCSAIGVLAVAVLLRICDGHLEKEKQEKEKQEQEKEKQDEAEGGAKSSTRTTRQRTNQVVGEVSRHTSKLLLGDELIPNLLLNLGFAFFMLIIATTYTSHLADYLSEKMVSAGFGSLGKLGPNASICVDELAEEFFRTDYPEYNFFKAESKRMPFLLREGKCTAAIMPQYMIQHMHAGKIKGFVDKRGMQEYGCDFQVASEEVLLTFAVSFPVNSFLAHSLSWGMTRALNEKPGKELRDLASAKQHQDRCPARRSKQFEALDLAGPFGGAVIVMVLGLTHRILCVKCHRRPKQQSAETENAAAVGRDVERGQRSHSTVRARGPKTPKNQTAPIPPHTGDLTDSPKER